MILIIIIIIIINKSFMIKTIIIIILNDYIIINLIRAELSLVSLCIYTCIFGAFSAEKSVHYTGKYSIIMIYSTRTDHDFLSQ